MELFYQEVLDLLRATTMNINLMKEKRQQHVNDYELNQHYTQTSLAKINHDLDVMAGRKIMLHGYLDQFLIEDDNSNITVFVSKDDWDKGSTNSR